MKKLQHEKIRKTKSRILFKNTEVVVQTVQKFENKLEKQFKNFKKAAGPFLRLTAAHTPTLFIIEKGTALWFKSPELCPSRGSRVETRDSRLETRKSQGPRVHLIICIRHIGSAVAVVPAIAAIRPILACAALTLGCAAAAGQRRELPQGRQASALAS